MAVGATPADSCGRRASQLCPLVHPHVLPLESRGPIEKIVEVQGKMQALWQELGSKETAPPSESSRRKR